MRQKGLGFTNIVMALRMLNPRCKTPLITVFILFLVYHTLNLRDIQDKVTNVNNEEIPNATSITKALEANSRDSNCRDFWSYAKRFDLSNDFNDTEFDLEKDTIWTKSSLFHKVKNQITLIRDYNHCFLDQGKSDLKLEQQLYPWLSFKSPVIKDTHEKRPLFSKKAVTLTDLKQNLEGKGIALSARELHLRELVNLITLFRALGTNIPIQIIHRGDFSKFAQIKLHQIAEAELTEDIQAGLDLETEKFTKMSVTFIDVSDVIPEEFEPKFKRFANKLLAYLFNTFEEVILIDADTIPFIPMQDFFQFEEYVKTGAFFFKDRTLNNGHGNNDTIELFKQLSPTTLEHDKLGIPMLTDFTMKNHYFNGFTHLMESGLVIVDRRKHFTNALMAITLSLYPNIISGRVWGDKELFWLAMTVSGDENYRFNEYFAASVGEISPVSNSHYPDQTSSKELCSNHPAHLYKNNKLLWMNTGFKYCKKLMHIDMENPFFKGQTAQEMNKFNSAPLRIRSALIPPAPTIAGELKVKQNGAPTYSWENKPYCEAYTMCAYDRIGDDVGTVVEFSTTDHAYFDSLGNTWFNGMEILKALAHQINKNKSY